jgi:hypothetical protein
MDVTLYAAAGALAAALLALVLYHLVVVRPAFANATGTLRRLDELVGAGTSATARLATLENGLARERLDLEGLSARLGELEALARTDVSRIGFVRYDAFDDTGSELSYALALLNREGDGVVVSSIYSRTDTRTYGKAVHGHIPAVNASEEELLAIERARSMKA